MSHLNERLKELRRSIYCDKCDSQWQAIRTVTREFLCLKHWYQSYLGKQK